MRKLCDRGPLFEPAATYPADSGSGQRDIFCSIGGVAVVKDTCHPPGLTCWRASTVACSMLSTARRVTTSNCRACRRLPVLLVRGLAKLLWAARACGPLRGGTRPFSLGILPGSLVVPGAIAGLGGRESPRRNRNRAGLRFPTRPAIGAGKQAFPEVAADDLFRLPDCCEVCSSIPLE